MRAISLYLKIGSEDNRLAFGWAFASITADGELLLDLQAYNIAPDDLETASTVTAVKKEWELYQELI